MALLWSVIYIGIYIEHILTERFGHETDQRDGGRGETTMAFLGDWRTYVYRGQLNGTPKAHDCENKTNNKESQQNCKQNNIDRNKHQDKYKYVFTYTNTLSLWAHKFRTRSTQNCFRPPPALHCFFLAIISNVTTVCQ